MDHNHCDCQPITCGNHILKPCAVSALKQVRSQTATDEYLFLVVGKDLGSMDIFVTGEDAKALLSYWKININDINHISGTRPSPTYVKRFKKTVRKGVD